MKNSVSNQLDTIRELGLKRGLTYKQVENAYAEAYEQSSKSLSASIVTVFRNKIYNMIRNKN